MREPAPAIFLVFRSRFTVAVLARTYKGDDEYSVAELAAMAKQVLGQLLARETVFVQVLDANRFRPVVVIEPILHVGVLPLHVEVHEVLNVDDDRVGIRIYHYVVQA